MNDNVLIMIITLILFALFTVGWCIFMKRNNFENRRQRHAALTCCGMLNRSLESDDGSATAQQTRSGDGQSGLNDTRYMHTMAPPQRSLEMRKADMDLEDCSVVVKTKKAQDLLENGWTCSICLDATNDEGRMGEGRILVALSCSHVFDRDCMWRWIAKGGAECPLCNYRIKGE
eukprot:Plantae.Rhodophyta-Hildenbrandia_rubra.ctg11849.p1 GENE.Plantae.Rhodophyta-Hildenbrandia_rubra.ctg11849~~Plantae.Rhodophyta-Hildenbrandia_rubra.ctg11849.p1  ORF type:complete len:174 (+),score=12.36 Plantae.Rhodophyta-Hildenbrandia_rubra.ctg11849:924-1445(+)